MVVATNGGFYEKGGSWRKGNGCKEREKEQRKEGREVGGKMTGEQGRRMEEKARGA